MAITSGRPTSPGCTLSETIRGFPSTYGHWEESPELPASHRVIRDHRGRDQSGREGRPHERDGEHGQGHGRGAMSTTYSLAPPPRCRYTGTDSPGLSPATACRNAAASPTGRRFTSRIASPA